MLLICFTSNFNYVIPNTVLISFRFIQLKYSGQLFSLFTSSIGKVRKTNTTKFNAIIMEIKRKNKNCFNIVKQFAYCAFFEFLV